MAVLRMSDVDQWMRANNGLVTDSDNTLGGTGGSIDDYDRDDSFITAIGKGVLSSTGNVIHTMNDAFSRMGKPAHYTDEEWAAKDTPLSKGISEFGHYLENKFQPNYEPWSVNRILSGLAGVAPYAVGLGMAGTAASQTGNYQMLGDAALMTASRLGLSPALANIISKAAPAVTYGAVEKVPEALIEWQGAYDDYIEKAKQDGSYVKGETEKAAADVSNKVFMDNVAFLTGTGGLEQFLLSRIPGAKGAKNLAKGLLGNSFVNMVEEVGQQIFPKHEAGENWNWTDTDILESGLIGALSGGGMHMGGAAADYLLSRGQAENEPGANENDEGTIGADGAADVDRFMAAISGQESGGNYDAENVHTGAAGAFQIMPGNWPAWSKEAGLGEDAPMTQENQNAVARYKMQQYYNQFGNWRDVAIAWYGGPGAVEYSEEAKNRPQIEDDGTAYPSINEYADSVMERMGETSGRVASQATPSGSITLTDQSYADFADFMMNQTTASDMSPERMGEAVDFFSGFYKPDGTFNNTPEVRQAIDEKYGDELQWFIQEREKAQTEAAPTPAAPAAQPATTAEIAAAETPALDRAREAVASNPIQNPITGQTIVPAERVQNRSAQQQGNINRSIPAAGAAVGGGLRPGLLSGLTQPVAQTNPITGMATANEEQRLAAQRQAEETRRIQQQRDMAQAAQMGLAQSLAGQNPSGQNPTGQDATPAAPAMNPLPMMAQQQAAQEAQAQQQAARRQALEDALNQAAGQVVADYLRTNERRMPNASTQSTPAPGPASITAPADRGQNAEPQQGAAAGKARPVREVAAAQTAPAESAPGPSVPTTGGRSVLDEPIPGFPNGTTYRQHADFALKLGGRLITENGRNTIFIGDGMGFAGNVVVPQEVADYFKSIKEGKAAPAKSAPVGSGDEKGQNESAATSGAEVVVTGDEFGEYKDLKELRKKAKEYYKTNLQGTSVENPILGKINLDDYNIEFTGSGMGKMASTSAKEHKLLLVKHLPELIRSAKSVTRSDNVKNKRDASQYAYLHSEAVIDGKVQPVTITIFTDVNGNKYYNHVLPQEEKSTKNKDLPVPPAQAPEDGNGIPAIGKSPVASTIPQKQQESKRESDAGSAGSDGKDTTVITDDGREMAARYKLVEADELVTSHSAKNGLAVNPDYPAELQPRDRQRVGMQQQITEMANKLRPEDLGESRNLNNGAPVVNGDNVVLNGNGRSIAIIRAMKGQLESGDKYRAWLQKNAAKFGLSPETVRGMKNPVLVRELTKNLSEAGGSRLGASEQAQQDAKKITPALLDSYQGGDLTAAGNRDFVAGILHAVIGKNEQNAYTDERGNTNADGIQRVKRALFALAYEDDALLAKMAESTEDDVRNVSSALLAAAPKMARLNLKMREGNAPKYELAKTITDAVKRLDSLRQAGKPVEMYLNEQTMFDQDTEEMRSLLSFLDKNKRSAKKITAFLNRTAELIDNMSGPNQQTLLDAGEVSLQEIFDTAQRDAANGGMEDMFAGSEKAAPEKSAKNKKNPDDADAFVRSASTTDSTISPSEQDSASTVLQKQQESKAEAKNAAEENGKQEEAPAASNTETGEDIWGKEEDALDAMDELLGKSRKSKGGKSADRIESVDNALFNSAAKYDDQADAILAELKEELKKETRKLSANPMFNPKLYELGLKYGLVVARRGARRFSAWAREMTDKIGEAIRPWLKSIWQGISTLPKGQAFDEKRLRTFVHYVGMQYAKGNTDFETVRDGFAGEYGDRMARDNEDYLRAAYEAVNAFYNPDAVMVELEEEGKANELSDDRGPGLDAERGRAGNDQDLVGRNDEEGGSVRSDGHRGREAGESGREALDESSVPGGRAALSGEAGNRGVQAEAAGLRDRGAGDTKLPGGVVDSLTRHSAGELGRGAEKPGAISPERRRKHESDTLKPNTAPGKQAGAHEKSVERDLPMLLPEQRQDVVFCEDRLLKNGGAGVMLTNGTGTGKTYSGMGLVKRFFLNGKKNILIVTPKDTINRQWATAARAAFDIPAHILENTKDAGEGVTVTTYANFAANPALFGRKWDLVIADECQELMSGKTGEATDALNKLRALTMHRRGFDDRFRGLHPKEYAELDDIMEKLRGSKGLKDEHLEERANAIRAKLEPLRKEAFAQWSAMPKEKKPRALFLSATPFSWTKDIDYAEGYLFDYGEGRNQGAYNGTSGRDQFFIDHFGYRMRYGKLTQPDAKVNTGVAERTFHEWLKKQGALSGRSLVIDQDYDRGFLLTPNDVGQKLDAGFDALNEKKYENLRQAVRNSFNRRKQHYLLEYLKAKEVVPVIQQYLDAGKKVVLFHQSMKEQDVSNPFVLDTRAIPATESREAVLAEYRTFQAEHPELFDERLGLDSLKSPIETIREAFADRAVFFNGKESNKNCAKAKEAFNDDDSGKDIIVVQQDKGNAGISLHDVTGKHPRVLLNLAIPTRPSYAIQSEGRIYRVGVKTNAVIRYLTTGTNMEKSLFASDVAQRSSTAENLSMGNQARALKDSFVNLYLETMDGSWERRKPGHKDEGTGGKAMDNAGNNSLSLWDMAKSYYYGQQKKTGSTKAQEGNDYFATPEPVGLKMVEWAGAKDGDKMLEPSAGHGAISRWFSPNTQNTIIEPSGTLSPLSEMVTENATTIKDVFENHNIVNKYDAVVMNPPFGTGGKMAVEHIAKAFRHLKEGGRLVALLPSGPSADKHFNKWFYGNAKAEGGKGGEKEAVLMKEVLLPGSTFERAGTKVATRIVVIDKYSSQSAREQAAAEAQGMIDLRDAKDVNALFDRLENLTGPARLRDGARTESREESTAEESRSTESRTEIVAGESQTMERQGAEESRTAESHFEANDYRHTKTGEMIPQAKLKEKVDDAAFKTMRDYAKANGGYYNRFSKSFLFKDFPQGRDTFVREMDAYLNGREEKSRTLYQRARTAVDGFLKSTWHDAQHQIDKYSQSVAQSKVNERQVARALREIVEGKEEVTVLGLRPDLAAYDGSPDVAFAWGNKKKGLMHIGARHGRDVIEKVIDTVLYGDVERFTPTKKTVTLEHNGYEAILSLDEYGKKKTWLLTGWHKNMPDATGAVSTQSGATQIEPTFSRLDLGAGLSNYITNLDSQQEDKGSYNITHRLMTLFQGADVSTPIHESAHWFMSEQEEIAKLAPDSRTAKDYQTLSKWGEWQPGQAEEYRGTITEKEFHDRDEAIQNAESEAEARRLKNEWKFERIARAFEEYLRDGKAPTKGLRGIFERFKNWLTQIYHDVTGAGVKPSKEVEEVFDRWIAKPEEIQTGIDAAMSAEEKVAYEKILAALTQNGEITPENRATATVVARMAGRLSEAYREAGQDKFALELLPEIVRGEKSDGAKASGDNSTTLYQRAAETANAQDQNLLDRAGAALAKKLKLGGDKIEVRETVKDPRAMGVLDRYVWSPSRIAAKFPAFKPFFKMADAAMKKLTRLRAEWGKSLDDALKLAGNKEYRQTLYDILWTGDAEGKDYTDAELREMGTPEEVIDAYRAVRDLMDTVYEHLNEARRRTQTISERMGSKKLAELRRNKFVEVLRVIEDSDGAQVVIYKKYAHWEKKYDGLSREAYEKMKTDDAIQILEEEKITDDVYSLKVREGIPAVTKRKGYIPHFFHEFMVRVEKEDGSIEMVGSGRTVREAVKVAEEYQKNLADGDRLIVSPKTFDFGALGLDEKMMAAVLGDKDYEKMIKAVAKNNDMELSEAKELLEGAARMKNRHRFNGNFLRRKGAKGFDENMEWVLRHHINNSSRYVAMETEFKPKAISLYERMFGDFSKEQKGIAQYAKEYINDVNGVPSALEESINRTLNNFIFWRRWVASNFGDRAALALAGRVSGAVSVLKLGMGNISSALLNLTQLTNAAAYIGDAGVLYRGLLKGAKQNYSELERRVLDETNVTYDIGLDSGGGYDRFKPGKLGELSMLPFKKSEEIVRRGTVLAAYEAGIKRGMDHDAAVRFAEEINRKSNFDYGVSDAPNVFRRGSIVAQLLLQFKKYPIKELEVMRDMLPGLSNTTNAKQKAIFWGSYFLLAGLFQIPFGDWFEDLAELIGLKPGPTLRKWIMQAAGGSPEGKVLGRMALYGIGGAVNVDISGRFGLGDVAHTDLSLEGIGGATVSTASKTAKMIASAFQGDKENALANLRGVSPGVANIVSAVTGKSYGSRGRVISEYNSMYDRILKAMGFRSADEAVASDVQSMYYDAKDEKAAEKKRAIDAYLRDESMENMERLKELGVTGKAVMAERRRKQQDMRTRLRESMSKKEQQEYQRVFDFMK